jgi:hypothetical protein
LFCTRNAVTAWTIPGRSGPERVKMKLEAIINEITVLNPPWYFLKIRWRGIRAIVSVFFFFLVNIPLPRLPVSAMSHPAWTPGHQDRSCVYSLIFIASIFITSIILFALFIYIYH